MPGWNRQKKTCWLLLSVDGVLLTAIWQTVCTLALCFNSSLSVGVEDSAHVWHHSFSGANSANLQHHICFSCNLWFMLTGQVYFSIQMLPSAALRGWHVMLVVGKQTVMTAREGREKDRWSDTWRERKRQEGFCRHSRTLLSLTRLYQQDGHLISLHSGTTTSVSTDDKSYWQLLPDRRGVMIEEGMWKCWKIDWN